MLRTFLILAALAPVIGAQTATAPETPPIEVTGQISQIDSQVWAGFNAGPGLFMSVRNVSAHGIRGYVYETVFTDAETGKALSHSRQHSTYKRPSSGVALAAGAIDASGKPYEVPASQSGIPAQFSFKVDLVIFDDGSTWGPGQLRLSKTLLTRIAAAN
jgi:hypothetical protein